MDCLHSEWCINPNEYVKLGDTVLLDGTGFKHKNGGKTYNIYRESEFLSILDEVVSV